MSETDTSILDSPEANAIASGQEQPHPVLDSPEATTIAQGGQQSLLDSPEANAIGDEETYSTPGQQAKAAIEGVGQGLVGPLAPLAEKAIGVDPKDILKRQEANQATHYAAEMAGLIAPALVTGGAATGAASLAKLTQAGLLSKLAFKGGETLASRVGAATARGIAENALIAGSDELSKTVIQDPSQTAESALANVGMSAALGGLIGAGLGGISEGWTSLNKSKVGNIAEEMKARHIEHQNDPNPKESVKAELETLYNSIKDVPVYGENGIKAEAIEKSMPEMSEAITKQSSELSQALDKASEKLGDDPHRRLLDNEIQQYKKSIDSNDPSKIFNATQKIKQQLQEWGKYNKNLVPLTERPFRNVSQALAKDLRIGLEDENVWGGAAKVQKDINSQFAKFNPTLEDIEKTFTTKIAGERVFDPAKISTYIDQLGKPNAEIKMQKVKNYIDKAMAYREAIDRVHASVGAESPFQPISLNSTMNTLQEKTNGAKIYDAFLGKYLADASGKAAGGIAGSLLGSLVGHGELGALIGSHALGPFFGSVLPSIANSVIKGPTSAEGMKAATDYTLQAVKGMKALNMGTKAVFNAAKGVIPEAESTAKDRERLDEKVKEFSENPQKLMEMRSQSHLGKLMPDHDAALNVAASNAIKYLNSLRPNRSPSSPLDPKPVPSSVEEAKYNNALNIANNPMSILKNVKNGLLTNQDIVNLKNLYPSLYNSMQQKLGQEAISAVTRGETIPYRTKMALSLFIGKPLDSTMSQPAILAAQPIQNQPQAPQQEQPKKGTKSSPALQKMGDMSKTPEQSREQRQQMRK